MGVKSLRVQYEFMLLQCQPNLWIVINRQVGKKQKISVRKWQYRTLVLAGIGKGWNGEGNGGVARRTCHFGAEK